MAEPLPSQLAVYPQFPIEVWEDIIDAAYDNRYNEVPIAVATLSSCALVCRAWRPRAQQVLFHYVILQDKDALYRFATLVEESPKLGMYVRQLALRGYLHVPHSPAVLFLSALRGKLTNLKEILFLEFDNDEKAAHPLPEREKELPCLPFHRYFQSLMTSVSHIRLLRLAGVRFTSFGDFARFLSALRNLEELYCGGVSWAVLGVEPACLAKRSSFHSRHMFLPNLKELFCVGMDEEGRQRLLSGLGPSLHKLYIKFPDSPPTLHVDHPNVNLRSFPHLDHLFCILLPFPHSDQQTLESLRDMLVSWVINGDHERGDVSPLHVQRYLYLLPWNRNDFTREQFVELLRTIGPIVEGALCRREPARAGEDTNNHPKKDPCMARLVVQDLGDRLEWQEWWKTAIVACFPTLARWRRLEVYPAHTNWLPVQWKDYDQTPQDYADRLQAESPRPQYDDQVHRHTGDTGTPKAEAEVSLSVDLRDPAAAH